MPRVRAERELARMLAPLRHESFYDIGTWHDEALGVYVGWTVQRNSFADGMPLRNERGDVVLVFSGEEFPSPETVQRLKQAGHRCDAGGASHLVHLYEESDTFPAALNGRFHGLLIDQTRGTALLFNDRYGMHRLYYHRSKEAFYFAAEAKAILAVRPETRVADQRGLGELVGCGCVLEDRTIFKDIRVLPSGSAWTFRGGALETTTKYFEPHEWEDQSPLDPEAYYREIRDIFARNLPRYFEAREPVGISLTGGLDTRMIMAWHKPPAGSLPCYTFGGTFRDSQDVMVAREVASASGQSHEVIAVGQEFLARFPSYAERTVYLSDGCADVSRSADLYVNEKARAIAPVRMTGNYGGEVLRRVRAFKPMEPLPGLYAAGFVPQIRQARATYADVIKGHPLSFAVFRQAPWHHHGLLALEQTQLSLRSPYLDNDFVRAVFRAPASALASNDLCLRLIAEGDAAMARIRTDRGPRGGAGPVSAAIARSRLEFLYNAEYAFDYGMPQWVAPVDQALSGLHLERMFLGRHKFCHFRVWYKDALARHVRNVLLDPSSLSRPHLERKTVEAVVDGHLKGKRNYTTEIHKLLTLEFIHRSLLDSGNFSDEGQ
jgi:asparagine synthase (glutamine-hydrolysing)